MAGKEVSTRQILLLVEGLAGQGCSVRKTKKGWIVFFPNGDSTVYHNTPSDVRATKNNRARVIRAGLHWPLDHKDKK